MNDLEEAKRGHAKSDGFCSGQGCYTPPLKRVPEASPEPIAAPGHAKSDGFCSGQGCQTPPIELENLD